MNELSRRTGYAVDPLDRLSEHREDRAFLDAALAAPDTRFVVIGRDKPLLRLTDEGPDAFFSRDEVARLGRVRETALLGRDAGGFVFAALLDDSTIVVEETPDEGAMIDTRRHVVPGRDDILVHDLRAMAVDAVAPIETLSMLGTAKSLMHWHARHRFCANCGASSETTAAGWRRECRSCRAQHFPRTDPVVIMMAVSGDDCLLGRSGRFGKGMYSALAGFLEPGETIEAAVRREIREESGVPVGRVAYLASQPWPFPASLMIGCIGEALDRTITVDKTELEDARWFSRRDVELMLARAHPDGYSAPHPLAIAHHLLRAWRDGETPRFD